MPSNLSTYQLDTLIMQQSAWCQIAKNSEQICLTVCLNLLLKQFNKTGLRLSFAVTCSYSSCLFLCARCNVLHNSMIRQVNSRMHHGEWLDVNFIPQENYAIEHIKCIYMLQEMNSAQTLDSILSVPHHHPFLPPQPPSFPPSLPAHSLAHALTHSLPPSLPPSFPPSFSTLTCSI